MPKLIEITPTATFTDKNAYFTEAARLTALPVETTDQGILRVTNQSGIRSSPDRMVENQFQREVRSQDPADSTFHDIQLIPSDGGQSHRLDVVNSQYIHDIAVARGYNPLGIINSITVPAEIQTTVATEVTAVASGVDSILWEVSVGGDDFSSDEFDDETAPTTNLTITATPTTGVVVRLTVTNGAGDVVDTVTSVIVA